MTALAAIRQDKQTDRRILEALIEDLGNADDLEDVDAARRKAASMLGIEVAPMQAFDEDEDEDWEDEEDEDEGLELGPLDEDEDERDAFGDEDEDF